MTFTLKDIKHLDVMANLANATPAPTQEINIKELLASDTIKEAGVNEKILSLCFKLRSEGFSKQAEGLENKFLAYKSASVHLYNTHNETGEDLINAAHPDGDNAICDATDGLGTVETVLSRHKKMVDVITKDPKGKLASQSNSKLIKKADVVIAEIGKKFKYMADYIQAHALTNVPEGESLKPGERKFYAAAALWHQIANLIATELNSPASLPEREAVQLVKNRLQNDPSVVINQHAGQVNSIAEIDQLIHNVLSRITDKNPNKFASKLLTYVGDCEEILKTAIPTRQITIDRLINAGAARIDKAVNLILTQSNIGRHGVYIKEHLADLQSAVAKGSDAANIMDIKHIAAKILAYASTGNQGGVKRYTDAWLNWMGSSIEDKPGATYEGLKNFLDGGYEMNPVLLKTALKGIQDGIKFFNKAESLYATKINTDTSNSELDTGLDAELDAELNTAPAAPAASINPEISKGVAQLNGFLAAASEPQKQKWGPWIQQQIKKFQDNANNPEKIKALLAENETFKTRMGLK